MRAIKSHDSLGPDRHPDRAIRSDRHGAGVIRRQSLLTRPADLVRAVKAHQPRTRPRHPETLTRLGQALRQGDRPIFRHVGSPQIGEHGTLTVAVADQRIEGAPPHRPVGRAGDFKNVTASGQPGRGKADGGSAIRWAVLPEAVARGQPEPATAIQTDSQRAVHQTRQVIFRRVKKLPTIKTEESSAIRHVPQGTIRREHGAPDRIVLQSVQHAEGFSSAPC